MLNALSRYEPRQASEILAATALTRASEAQEAVGPYAREIEEVLRELRALHQIPLGDESPKARSKLDHLISEEIKNMIFSNRNLKEVKARLGLRGELPIGGYTIKVAVGFKKATKENLGFIEKSVRFADEIRHFPTELAGELQADRGLSILARRVPSRSGSEHWLVMNALRIGDELTIAAAWRVFPEVVDVTGLTDPYIILNRFVEAYGIEVEVFGVARGKILQNVRLKGLTLSDDLDSYRIVHNEGKAYTAVEMGALLGEQDASGNDTVAAGVVLLKYAIDLKRYRADVLRFG
jgi:hypothetical protein